jgi:hypothetical protein
MTYNMHQSCEKKPQGRYLQNFLRKIFKIFVITVCFYKLLFWCRKIYNSSYWSVMLSDLEIDLIS